MVSVTLRAKGTDDRRCTFLYTGRRVKEKQCHFLSGRSAVIEIESLLTWESLSYWDYGVESESGHTFLESPGAGG